VLTRAPRRGESIVQGDFAVADPPESGEARGTHSVRLRFACGITQFGQFGSGHAQRGLDFIQSFRIDQHREFTVEARRPCR
jgi:hypothetical protein